MCSGRQTKQAAEDKHKIVLAAVPAELKVHGGNLCNLSATFNRFFFTDRGVLSSPPRCIDDVSGECHGSRRSKEKQTARFRLDTIYPLDISLADAFHDILGCPGSHLQCALHHAEKPETSSTFLVRLLSSAP